MRQIITLAFFLLAFQTHARIITLSPHATELVIAAGGKEQLIAVAAYSPEIPPQAQTINSFGGLDREAILLLAPSLIVTWPSGMKPNDLAWLEQQQIPLIQSEPQTLADIADDIRRIGHTINTPKTANQAADEFIQALEHVCQPTKKQAALLALWDAPLVSVGNKHWLNEVLNRAGYHNIFHALDRGIFTVEKETAMLHSQAIRIASKNIKNQSLSRPSPRVINAIKSICSEN